MEPALDDFDVDDSHHSMYQRLPSLLSSAENNSRPQGSFYTGYPDHKHYSGESETLPRRMRMRPSHEQTEELKQLYAINPHPSKEEREELGDRIGMYVLQLLINGYCSNSSTQEISKHNKLVPKPKKSRQTKTRRRSRQWLGRPPKSHRAHRGRLSPQRNSIFCFPSPQFPSCIQAPFVDPRPSFTVAEYQATEDTKSFIAFRTSWCPVFEAYALASEKARTWLSLALET